MHSTILVTDVFQRLINSLSNLSESVELIVYYKLTVKYNVKIILKSNKNKKNINYGQVPWKLINGLNMLFVSVNIGHLNFRL